MISAASAALASALLHFVWQGALIALVLAISLRAANSSARSRYGLACAALLLMALTFGATFLWMLPPAASYPATLGVRFPVVPPVFPALPALDRQAASSQLAWIVPIWLFGVALFYCYRVAGWFAAQRLRRFGVCIAPEPWQARLRDLSQRVRLSRPVVLLESTLAQTPLTIGMLRPVILIPLGMLAGLPAAQVEAVLLHELAHIRRHDYLVNLAQSVIEGLLFYHPAVWWISHRIRAEREFCCDDMVVAATNDATSFVEALNTLEHRRDFANQAALAATSGPLVQRVRRLLGTSAPTRGLSGPVLGLLLLATCVALVAWQPEPAPLPEPSPAPSPAPAPAPAPQQTKQGARQQPRANVADPYQRWLDEEVVYIINPNERDAFLRLRTDEERQRFIEQFWFRRDPTPGTEENEFREELYRRIAFSNDRFTSGDTPGWRTQRGAIYISYGPPDEINEIAAPPKSERSETWHYRYIEGSDVTIRFLDSSTGDQAPFVFVTPLAGDNELMNSILRRLKAPGTR